MLDESFSKTDRVKSAREFEIVFKKGVVVADDILIVHATRSLSDRPRLGIGVGKRTGNAPLRNRWKRLIREAFRKHKSNLPLLDIIVRPKRGAAPDFHRIDHAFPKLIHRALRKVMQSETPIRPSQNQSSPHGESIS